jgi:hypothetical protein
MNSVWQAVGSIIMVLVVSSSNLQIANSADGEWQPVKYDRVSQKYVYNTVSSFSRYGTGIWPGSVISFYQYGDGYNRQLKCDFLGDEICTPERMKTKGVQVKLVFPKCDESDSYSNYCIKDVRVYKDNGLSASAKFVKYVDGEQFDSNAKYLLPKGGTSSIWSVKNEESGLDDLYLVDFEARLTCRENCASAGFNGTITPIKIVYGDMYKGDFAKNTINGNSFQGIQWQRSLKCERSLYTSAGECGQKSTFITNLRIGVSLLVPKSESVFIDSRIVDSVINTELYKSNSKIVKIDGLPMSVPRVSGVMTSEQAQGMLNLLDPQPLVDMDWNLVDNRQDKNGLKELEYIRKISGDRVSGFENIWGFSSGKLQNCSNVDSAILGEVSSNAMVVDPNPGRFENSEFIYEVAGMHFEPDGKTLTRGNYALKVSKALVKCLYNNSSVPLKASVSIISGESKVSTEAISEIGNYYAINISNFNFSNPSIRVKLEFGKDSAITSPSPSPSPTKVLSLKKTTITCVKGKLTKKVTALKPKCPAGYKKK